MLDQGFEDVLIEERLRGGYTVVCDVHRNTHPGLRHHDSLSALLQNIAIWLAFVECTMSLKVNQALLAPGNALSICFFDVGHEIGEARIAGVFSTAVDPISTTRLPIEKIERLDIVVSRDGDRCSRHPFLGPEGEGVDANLDLILDCLAFIWTDGGFDVNETYLAEYMHIPLRSFRKFYSTTVGRQR